MATKIFSCIELIQNTKPILITTLPAGVVIKISYAAVRGQSSEDGAVQRILNPRRISSIKKFAIDVGDFPGVVILNWVNEKNPLQLKDSNLILPVEDRSAQIIDGQHRLAGIRAAVEEKRELDNLQLPVAIYRNLTTRQCADIFLSINTEQKTVPRSLVFDLYGLASEPNIDAAATRARDIAMFLNEEENSPYKAGIKLPGTPIKKGGIALSTAVTALKDLVEERGDFEQIGIQELERQQQVILNYFNVLKGKYQGRWNSSSNAFMYASGFTGAVDFFRKKIMPFCNQKKSFQVETISGAIKMEEENLVMQDEIKGLGGKESQKKIFDRLNDMFTPDLPDLNDIKI